MNASLRTLLSGLIDYAGLFPPAQLPLDQAIRNYARYRREPDAWMLGRFVISVGRLDGLVPFWQELSCIGSRLALAVLSPQGGDGRAKDHQTLLDFSDRHGAWAGVETLEVQLPVNPRPSLADAIHSWARLEEPVDTVYFEAADGDDWRPRVQATTAALRSVKRLLHEGNALEASRVGFKLRCGGLDAAALPSVEQVAFVLHAGLEAGAPLKFTAGLHHPIRRFDAGLQTPMHGFINVFVAGVLAHARRLDEDSLRTVIADEDASHFRFTDDGLSWKDVTASTAEVAAARRDFVTSFGSCSFDEPRDDLRALGWL